MMPFRPPDFYKKSFNCPYCDAFAHQNWNDMRMTNGVLVENLKLALCAHCGKYSIWYDCKMIYPDTSEILPPNLDLNQEIRDDYMEARSIVNKSPRGATALLRLCIQKLCQQLGEPGKNINDDIATLVKKRLPSQIQKALDIVRVVGNNAVHPGQIDLKDNVKTANKLFELVNLIAQVMITQPKEIEQLYEEIIPKTDKEKIEKRDKS